MSTSASRAVTPAGLESPASILWALSAARGTAAAALATSSQSTTTAKVRPDGRVPPPGPAVGWVGRLRAPGAGLRQVAAKWVYSLPERCVNAVAPFSFMKRLRARSLKNKARDEFQVLTCACYRMYIFCTTAAFCPISSFLEVQSAFPPVLKKKKDISGCRPSSAKP